jgi:hypothetical protein
MDEQVRQQLAPGTRVKITQQIPARHYAWSSEVRGTVVEFQQRQTGSWFAHAKNDKLWLDRLVLRKDDGEMTTLILDDYSRIEVEPSTAPAPAAATAPAASEGAKKNESDLPV